jgi:murein tripeptide amidase MpaA
VTLFVLRSLLSQYDSDAEVKEIMDNIEFVIAPHINPDGYEYSRSNNRMWRKNRGERSGVDLNRNWDDHWGQSGASRNPWSETYMGPSAASEPEVKACQAYMATLKNMVAGNVHVAPFCSLRSVLTLTRGCVRN